MLVSPLNWGLGHATRCIPIIRQLLLKGMKVSLAAYGNSLSLLRSEFPDLDIIELKSFSPDYPRNGAIMFRMVLLIPSFLWSIINEHYYLSSIIKNKQIDVVISDNRYGLWNRKIRSILITHQVFIRSPKRWGWLNPFLQRISHILISRFDECWIPDYSGDDNLSGVLSHLHPLPEKYCFIGPLSRLESNSPIPLKKEGILVLLSGPEPQRSILEELLLAQLKELNQKAHIIRGIVEHHQQISIEGNLTIMNFATSEQVQDLITNNVIVICRSGYSTIMDIASIGGKALFIPTPGQTEQEYLSEYFMTKGIALSVDQNKLFLPDNIPAAITFKGFKGLKPNLILNKRIDLLTSIK